MYKAKIQSDVSLDKLKMIISVRGDLQNKEMVGDTWSPTASMRTLKYLLADEYKHEARLHQLYFIGSLFQAKVKNRVIFKLDIRCTYYFPEYAKYFRRALRLLKSMYGTTNSGNLIADELTEWLHEAFLCNHNVRCLYIIIMHQMDQKLLFYLMLMIVSIGMRIKILENGLLIIWERDSMQNSWDMHIGSFQSVFLR